MKQINISFKVPTFDDVKATASKVVSKTTEVAKAIPNLRIVVVQEPAKDKESK